MPANLTDTPPKVGQQVGRRSRVVRVAAIAVVILVVLAAIGAVLAERHWPFSQAAFQQTLEADSQSHVQFTGFRETYFPYPGVVAEGVVFQRDASSPKLTVRRLTVVGSYFGLLHRYIPEVRAEGATLSVPPGGLKELFSPGPVNPPSPTPDTTVGEIDADDAEIDVASPDGQSTLPFKFHKFKLQSVSKTAPVEFHFAVLNPEPQGDLQLDGKIGPFRRGNAGQTPLHGSYVFKNAKLEQFAGVGGVLSSEGKFDGPLQAIGIDGTTDTPDFELDVGIHPVHLKNQFHAVVDGRNGDVQLDPVRSHFGRTTIVTRGNIEGPSDAKDKKAIALDMVSPAGRVEDLLQLFVHDDRPPMTGAIVLRAHVLVPPEDRQFLKKVRLTADFGISGAAYNPATQKDVDILSARARGQADKIEDDEDRDRKKGTDTVDRDLERVVSNLKGHVALQNGVANFKNLSFDVPGASALVNGTYNLLSREIDMHGTVQLQSQLSGATTGVKSFLLKIVQPLSKSKKNEGAVVAVRITGTYGHPVFAVTPIPGAK